MPHYFAFGSNMHRRRLERRVGPVVDGGCAALFEYCHGFTKRGADGSGKGNIAPCRGSEVYGVLYELSDEQLVELGGYEGGYDRVELSVRAGDGDVVAVSFRAPGWISGLVPTEAYLEHYRRGMHEHALPEHYVELVLAQATAGAQVADL